MEIVFLAGAIALTLGFLRSYYRIRTYRDPEEEDSGQKDDPENLI